MTDSRMARMSSLKICIWMLLPCVRFCGGSDGVCKQTDHGVVCDEGGGYRLTRIRTRKVGEEKQFQLEDRSITMRTLSLQPLLFEIPHFLSESECDHFIKLATDQGLQASKTIISSATAQGLTIMDTNGDKKLSLDEMRRTIENGFDIYPDDEDILQLYADKQLDENGDGFITKEEMGKITPHTLGEYLEEFVRKQPEKHSRFSNQVWLFPDESADKTFRDVQKRVAKVTDLPLELIRMSDFQVVQYDSKGHYNAHYDSSTIDLDLPCCRRFDKRRCRICRYMTVLFYLNDVEEGGETAFPVADNTTFDEKLFRGSRLMNLYRRCSDANLSVTPGKGKAVLWYNHYVNEDNQWLGDMDLYSVHGGCAVKAGKKWIANFWIKVSDNKAEDIILFEKLKYQD